MSMVSAVKADPAPANAGFVFDGSHVNEIVPADAAEQQATARIKLSTALAIRFIFMAPLFLAEETVVRHPMRRVGGAIPRITSRQHSKVPAHPPAPCRDLPDRQQDSHTGKPLRPFNRVKRKFNCDPLRVEIGFPGAFQLPIPCWPTPGKTFHTMLPLRRIQGRSWGRRPF